MITKGKNTERSESKEDATTAAPELNIERTRALSGGEGGRRIREAGATQSGNDAMLLLPFALSLAPPNKNQAVAGRSVEFSRLSRGGLACSRAAIESPLLRLPRVSLCRSVRAASAQRRRRRNRIHSNHVATERKYAFQVSLLFFPPWVSAIRPPGSGSPALDVPFSFMRPLIDSRQPTAAARGLAHHACSSRRVPNMQVRGCTHIVCTRCY